MSKFIVGLTGGIGSGKTTVATMFANLAVDLIDADIVARAVVEPNSKALQQISAHFGEDYLTENGALNRAKLRQKIFSNTSAKQWLDNLLHPLIRQQLLTQLTAAKSQYCLLIAPLLIENKLTNYVNRTLVIDVDEQQQLSRTMTRDHNTKAQIQNIMASQLSRQQRLSAADDIIDNSSSDLAKINAQVEHFHQFYLKLSQEH
jgi:dephospho-CoA kinase